MAYFVESFKVVPKRNYLGAYGFISLGFSNRILCRFRTWTLSTLKLCCQPKALNPKPLQGALAASFKGKLKVSVQGAIKGPLKWHKGPMQADFRSSLKPKS